MPVVGLARVSRAPRFLRRVRTTHRRQSSRLPASIQFCHEISSQSQRNIPIPQPNPRYSLFNPSSGFDSSQGITSGVAGGICDVAQSRSHSAIEPLGWKALAACFSAGPKCHCEHRWKPGKIGEDATEQQRLSILVAARRRVSRHGSWRDRHRGCLRLIGLAVGQDQRPLTVRSIDMANSIATHSKRRQPAS